MPPPASRHARYSSCSPPHDWPLRRAFPRSYSPGGRRKARSPPAAPLTSRADGGRTSDTKACRSPTIQTTINAPHHFRTGLYVFEGAARRDRPACRERGPARRGVAVAYVPFARPGELADAAGQGIWDIGLIAAEPARAETIAFSPAYAEIEATYLVPAGSPLTTIEEVDRPGVRVAIAARSAYDLWLSRHLRYAELVRSGSLDASFEQFVAEKLDALAGLRPRLLQDIEKLPGARILDGRFTAVQQAVGTAQGNQAGARFLHDFVEDAKASGLVARLIERHHVRGLSVAPPG